MMHEFIVVDSLVTPAILGADSLQENNVALDFSSSPVTVFSSKVPSLDSCQQKLSPNDPQQELWKPVWEDERKIGNKICATLTSDNPELDAVDECSIPWFSKPGNVRHPKV